ncbi:hypothetical protein [Amycolatopsis sp. cmx-8-4]|uniref:hypothetical protein n=1 Tax=Amycolatopsis sp. cmx-8-4 TaxID=2790947 RepID=UPI003978E3B2
MYPTRFSYEAPRELDEALGLLRDHGDEAKVLAGGQSLVPLMKLPPARRGRLRTALSRFAPFARDALIASRRCECGGAAWY